MASSKSLQTINAEEGVEKMKHSCTAWGECKLIQPLWKTVAEVRIKDFKIKKIKN